MAIYEYYCPDNHRIYQFYARTLAQGRTVPPCPDNPGFRMRRLLSPFAVVGSRRAKAEDGAGPPGAAGPPEPAEDARMEAAMGEMEREFSGVDENDPRAMGRMMRRMAALTGERIEGEMEEVVRKLEEGADPDSLEDGLEGGAAGAAGEGPGQPEPAGKRHRFRGRRGAPVRDPRLHDYPP